MTTRILGYAALAAALHLRAFDLLWRLAHSSAMPAALGPDGVVPSATQLAASALTLLAAIAFMPHADRCGRRIALALALYFVGDLLFTFELTIPDAMKDPAGARTMLVTVAPPITALGLYLLGHLALAWAATIRTRETTPWKPRAKGLALRALVIALPPWATVCIAAGPDHAIWQSALPWAALFYGIGASLPLAVIWRGGGWSRARGLVLANIALIISDLVHVGAALGFFSGSDGTPVPGLDVAGILYALSTAALAIAVPRDPNEAR